METRVYGLIIGLVGTAAFITILAGLLDFQISAGFWGFLGVIVTFITTITVSQNRRNGGPPDES